MQNKPIWLPTKLLEPLGFKSYDANSGDRIGEEDADKWAEMTAMDRNLSRRKKAFYNMAYPAEVLETWEEWQVN